jgi:hypothetical protein
VQEQVGLSNANADEQYHRPRLLLQPCARAPPPTSFPSSSRTRRQQGAPVVFGGGFDARIRGIEADEGNGGYWRCKSQSGAPGGREAPLRRPKPCMRKALRWALRGARSANARPTALDWAAGVPLLRLGFRWGEVRGRAQQRRLRRRVMYL